MICYKNDLPVAHSIYTQIFSVKMFFVRSFKSLVSVYWQFYQISGDKIHNFGLIFKMTDKNHVSASNEQKNAMTKERTN